MDPITLGIITSLATGYFVNFSTPVIKDFFEKAVAIDPEIENSLQKASTPDHFEKVFKDAINVIDIAVNNGSVEIDGGFLEALRGIRFDHNSGTVNIAGTTLKSEIIVTGGSKDSTGKTTISNTQMSTKGTSISVNGNAKIVISGNASIKQG